MCGIAGLVDTSLSRSAETLSAAAERMASAVRHRGPDDAGTWVEESTGLAFGHRRLAVIDLSVCGHQPMVSASGRWVIAYNGEIYNHAELRHQLVERGASLRGTSDTEVLLEYIDRFGFRTALERADGMFALAAWDRREQVLTLARDRVGEKPLYYGWAGRTLVFGSELKALTAHPDFDARIDRSALTAYMRLGYVPCPMSIYEDVSKLPPGCYLEIRPHESRRLDDPVPYWRYPAAASTEAATADDLLDELDELLREAVSSRLVADVPVGAFLSGGIDSSLVVALMQQVTSGSVRTFSIGFEEAGYNEAEYAKAVARHLGTEHHELYVSSSQALDVVPRLPEIYDEPFADSSQIPTYLVSELTRRHVTVALSGDAGDELFGGYDRYRLQTSIWRVLDSVPASVRTGAARAIEGVDVRGWDRMGRVVNAAVPRRYQQARLGDRAHKAAGLLSARDPNETYRMLMSHWREPDKLVVGGREPSLLLADASRWPRQMSKLGQAMYVDALTYLPDDILVKVDRAAMAVSLETRVPLLAPAVIDFASRLPDSLRVRGGRGKWLLRKLLHRYVPAELVDRPKMGFGVPIGDWLRGPLREWAEDLLSPDALRATGYLDVGTVRDTWEQHLSGHRDFKYQLWNVLMFLEWCRSQDTQPSAESDYHRAVSSEN